MEEKLKLYKNILSKGLSFKDIMFTDKRKKILEDILMISYTYLKRQKTN